MIEQNHLLQKSVNSPSTRPSRFQNATGICNQGTSRAGIELDQGNENSEHDFIPQKVQAVTQNRTWLHGRQIRSVDVIDISSIEFEGANHEPFQQELLQEEESPQKSALKSWKLNKKTTGIKRRFRTGEIQ